MVHFLSELGSHIIDTYLVVLVALDCIIQGNMVIKERAFVQTLHSVII